jgi:hypothetical protein
MVKHPVWQGSDWNRFWSRSWSPDKKDPNIRSKTWWSVFNSGFQPELLIIFKLSEKKKAKRNYSKGNTMQRVGYTSLQVMVSHPKIKVTHIMQIQT